MASTAISEISAAIIRRGHPITRYVPLAASTYIPGDWVYYNATFEVTAIASGTSVLMKPFLLGFEPRITSTKARKDIDDAVALDTGPIIWAGATGPLIVAATMENPAATKLKSMAFMISNTAGDLEFIDNGVDPTGGVCSVTNIFLWKDTVTGDTVGYFLMY